MTKNDNSRERTIYKVTLLGSFVNMLLVVIKFIFGILGCSAAMIAEQTAMMKEARRREIAEERARQQEEYQKQLQEEAELEEYCKKVGFRNAAEAREYKERYPDFMRIEHTYMSRQGDYYILTVNIYNLLTNEIIEKEQKYVIKEKDFLDYVLSFQVR